MERVSGGMCFADVPWRAEGFGLATFLQVPARGTIVQDRARGQAIKRQYRASAACDDFLGGHGRSAVLALPGQPIAAKRVPRPRGEWPNRS